MYKKIILKLSVFFVLLLSFKSQLRADEGMWLLALLKSQNAEELKAMGLKIPIEKLTGENEGALSEAVVGFGSGCSGSLISKSGLLLTNYHCSYDAIQQYVSPTNDIFKNGYWAKTSEQELRVNGLTVTVNKKILDITKEVKGTGKDNIKSAMDLITQRYKVMYPKYNVVIKPYKNNTLFVLFLQLQYKDVRLVGLAPKNVTKFGGETDNWMWPRYSAEFAYFRVYADKNGNPASFSQTNVPLSVKNYLHISTEGYKKGDFAMSMGYPSMSDRNATSSQIWQKIQAVNPPMIAVRKLRQAILDEEMAKSNTVKHLYAEKYATSANYYKNAVGMNYWVDKLQIIPKKEAYEKEWLSWVMQDEKRKTLYSTILQDQKAGIESNAKLIKADIYYAEFNEACDLLNFLSAFGLGFIDTAGLKNPSSIKALSSNVHNQYSKINIDVDKRIIKAMLKLLKDSLPADLQPKLFASSNFQTADQIDKYVDDIFKASVFADITKLENWFKKPFSLKNDPLFLLGESISTKKFEIFDIARSKAKVLYPKSELYNSSLAEYKSGRYYPDADKTIRLSYGTISDLKLDDKNIPYQTSFSDLIERATNTSNKDYELNPKLQETWQNKSFGKYGVSGDMPVCFVTNGDVTGGNSGSPMMNADGKLIGLVFDCNWESMTREFNYDKDLHRVICVDIRYLLLVTEKFSGTKRIISEIEESNQGSI